VTVEKSEQELLEGKLDTALAEAETKILKAVESLPDRSVDSEKDVWAAAEAAEFASLVYALTYGLEESSGNTSGKREIVETLTVLNAAAQDLKIVQTFRGKRDKDSLMEGYKLLRGATDSLRNAYLGLTRTGQKPQASI
jgi:hypothetical protein